MKETIFKSVTALLCVVALCITSSVAVGKYGDAIKEAAKYAPAASAGGSDASADDPAAPSDDPAAPSDDPAAPADDPAAPSDDPAAPADDPSASGDNSGNNNAAPNTPSKNNGSNSSSNSNANDPTKYTTAQAVAYYNSCLKNSYKQKVTINRTEKITIIADSVEPGGDTIKNVVNKIVERYANTTEASKTFTNGKSSDGETAESFAMKTGLQAAGAKSASIKKSGSGYEITINVVPETATLTSMPKYNKQCASPLDLSTVDLFGVKVKQTDFTYPGTTLKATVDAKGRVTSASVNMPLSGVGGGSFIGISITGKLHGSFYKTAKFVY